MRYRATLGLGLILGATFAVQLWFAPPVLEGLYSVRLGAVNRWLARDGQLFRLATAALLHAGCLHFLATTAMSLAFCSDLERRWGSARAVSVIASSTLAGFVAVAMAADGPTFGSSGITHGLMGGWSAMVAGTQPRGWLGAVIVPSGLAVELLVDMGPFISSTGHLGGFIGGVATGLLLHPRGPDWTDGLARVWAVAMVGIHLSLLSWGALALSAWTDRDLFDAAPLLYEQPEADPHVVTAMAFAVSESALATDLDRRRAYAALERQIERFPASSDLRHMHALQLEERGDYDAARSEMHLALSLGRDRSRAVPLAWADAAVFSDAPAVSGIRPRLDEDGAWRWTVEKTLERGCEWHLLGLQGREPRAYLLVELGADWDTPVLHQVAMAPGLESMRWVATHRRCDDTAVDALEVRYWELEPAPES